MSKLRSWLVTLITTILCLVQTLALSAKDGQETLDLFVQSAEAREQSALEALDWKLAIKMGHCDSWEDALKHNFSDKEPVDEYHVHWQSNRGSSLYEFVPKQDVRVLENDAANRITTTTFGFSAWMFTPNTRLRYDGGNSLTLCNDWDSRSWSGPGSLPLHSGRFGMGRSHVLKEFAADAEVTVTAVSGLTDLGHEATILSLKTRAKPSKVFPPHTTVKYLFENQSQCLLQTEKWYGDQMRSKMLVSETAAKQVRGKTIVFPMKYVVAFRSSEGKNWYLRVFETTQLNAQEMPIEKMELKINKPNTIISLAPRKRHLSAEVGVLTPADLDNFSDKLLEEYDSSAP
jgi:hypothetical protein